ncbi:HD domain-containing protein [Nonlabens antarcticus]|uniref:HD domain-containing protein n=1 Tax=Nonlabens antarcticus TaxID=392714 RepID=UPI001891EB45|nr:HD domain-containing protein [Nonlabens antarcticus]
MNKELIDKVRVYCKEVMESSRCKKLQFHNWQHTKDVVENSELIARNEKLTEEMVEELIISSYFHDLGNTQGSTDHEKRSCEYAQEFLTAQGYSDQKIMNILYNIKATTMPQHPETISEKVICDADLAHLGKANFLDKNKALRLEWERYSNVLFTDEQWIGMNVSFLSQHSFHTDFAKEYYGTQKIENIKALNIYKSVG